MNPSWADALTEMDARLDGAAAALDLGNAGSVEAFEPPPLGPLDAELVDRAREIVERGEELRRRLERESERIRKELRQLPRLPASPGAGRFEIDA